jgi:hypothetical protein
MFPTIGSDGECLEIGCAQGSVPGRLRFRDIFLLALVGRVFFRIGFGIRIGLLECASSLASIGDIELGEFFDDEFEMFTVLEVFAQERDFVCGDSFTSVFLIFPALMFEVGAFPESAVAAGLGHFAVFFKEGSAFDGGNGGELSEEGLALALG